MTPLEIRAEMMGGVQLTSERVAIDAMLAWVVCRLEGRPPLLAGAPVPDVPIPVEKEPGGRFHLASFSVVDWALHERRFTQRRFPVGPAQMLAVDSFRRINVSAGAQKSFRLPCQIAHATDGAIRWYAVGDEAGVRDLLRFVTHVGRRRAVGRGRVARWVVESCEPWGDGFPVARDGRPLRPLPPDWPGLSEPALAYEPLTYPYWDRTRETLCAVPS